MVAEGYGEGVRFPRLPWGPEVPPSNTAEGAKFTLRWLQAITALSVGLGVVYSTGVFGNDRSFGVLLLVVSVPMLLICWRIARVERRIQATKDEPPHSLR